MSVEVTAITVYFQDGNSDKFYRVYYFDRWCFFQNGRRGVTGQFRDITRHNSPTGARAAALTKMLDKKNEGYTDQEKVTFLFDMTGWTGSKQDCQRLDGVRRTRGVNAPPNKPVPAAVPAPTPAAVPAAVPATEDRLGAFTSNALATIAAAVSDPSQARQRFAHLNVQYAELERDMTKARSYLTTLDKMLGGTLA